jgi:acyl-CoA thioester hydrolase
MKPPMIAYEALAALPVMHQTVIPPEYEDENGHMNFRWYFELFNEGGMTAFAQLGFTADFPRIQRVGVFDLEYHVHFVSEVLIGDTASVRVRMVGRSEKRMHYLVFIVNDTRQTLAAMFECVSTFADLNARRSTAMPDVVRERVDGVIAEHSALAWEAPTCGVMRA